MATITAITESSTKDGRYVVALDGKPVATVSLDILERLRLAVGVEADEARRAEIREAAAELKTYDRALNMLAFRARSARELARQLVRKGESASHVDAAVARLTAAGLLDDADYARQYSRSKVLGQGLSKRRLRQELFKRGVARETAEDAIGEVMADESVDEEAIIERVARRKLRTLVKLDAATRRRRLYAFLARRGYESDDIRRAMAEVLEEPSDDGDGRGTEAEAPLD